MNWIFVFVGGGFGSLTRFLISERIPFHEGFPWATFLSNMLATLLLGIVMWLNHAGFKNDWLLPLLGIGFCGGFSTFSTFSAESVQLLQQGAYGYFTLNVLLSFITGFGILYLLFNQSKYE